MLQDLFGSDKALDTTVRSSHFCFWLATQQYGKYMSSCKHQQWSCRRVARAEDESELASVGQQIGGSGNDWDEEVLSAEEEGLVFFDGDAQMHCSAITK